MKAWFFPLIFAALTLLALTSCGDGGGSNSGGTSSGSAPANAGPAVSVATSVPPAAAGKITSISSSTADLVPGQAIPLQSDGTVPFLAAGDASGNPYLLSIGNTTGVLDAASTAMAMVRIALDAVQLPPGLKNDQLTKAIQSSSNFTVLLTDVQQDLAAGNSPLSDTQTASAAWAVALDASTSIGTSSPSAAVVAAQNPTNVTTPLPFYLHKGSQPFDKIWLTDLEGNNVNVNNQTFITWQVITSVPTSGAALGTTDTPPLTTTTSQLFAYYGGSASVTPVNGASPSFSLQLSQSPTTRQINGIAAFIKYVLFMYSSVAKLYPNPRTTKCVSGIASSIFNDQFPNFVTQPDGATAGTYLAQLLPISASGDIVYKKFSACGLLPSGSTLFASYVSKIWPTLNIGGFVNKAWEALDLARGLVSTVGAVAETFAYWNQLDNFQICKSGGNVVNCGASVSITNATCVKVGDSVRDPTTFELWGPTFNISFQGSGNGVAVGDQMFVVVNAFPGCNGCVGPPDTISCSAGWQAFPPGHGTSKCTQTGAVEAFSFTFSETFSRVLNDETPPQSVGACMENAKGDPYVISGAGVQAGDYCSRVPLNCH